MSFFISSPGPKVQVNYCHHLASVVCRLVSVVCCLSSVVCKLFTFQASSPNPLGRLEPNLAGMFLGWSPFKIVSVSPVLYPRWPPLLKIEISSNAKNCSILSQKVPKFELYNHNELFSSPRPSLGVRRLSSVVCRLSSVNFSHFKLLLRNHWANCNQTLVEWSWMAPF